MPRIKFSLRLLILLVTALGLFLGYSQYRRREILKVCVELEKANYAFVVPSKWHDLIWQRRPIIGTITVATMDGKTDEVLLRPKEAYSEDGTPIMLIEATNDSFEIERMKKLGMIEYK
jgi:hypothetical protein